MITILHTGQTGVERGADRAARASALAIAGYSQFEQRDELGVLPLAIAADLVKSDRRGARSTWEPTLALADALILLVPDATRSSVETGMAALRRLAVERGIPAFVVDPARDFGALASEIRALELVKGSAAIMVSGPRATRWVDGEKYGFRLVAQIGLVAGGETRRVQVVGVGENARQFRRAARALGHNCELGPVTQALELANQLRPDVIVVDLATPSSEAVAWQIRCELRTPIYVAAMTTSPVQRLMGVQERIVEPFDIEAVRSTLVKAATKLRTN
ncbi:MAG: putative molybdenum carrier protein [Kofleriaceae bacterium]